MTLASQSLIAIRKDNLLVYYHAARVTALKTTIIQSAFQKTRIWPLDRHAIPLSAIEPSKTTTTQAVQPLPAHLPSILVLTPTPTPIPSVSGDIPSCMYSFYIPYLLFIFYIYFTLLTYLFVTVWL